MKILAFDTSSKALSVAVLEDSSLLADISLNIKKNHSISLMPSIDFLMSSIQLEPQDIDRIVVAQGPGSYTGLRVAVATAKMLAYSLNCELVGVSSLQALCPNHSDSGLVVPLIDARRQHAYAGFYQNGEVIYPDAYLSLDTILERVKDQKDITFVGEISAFRDRILEFIPQAKCCETLPSAYVIGLIGKDLPAEDCDAMVPNYLKRVEAEEIWLESHQENTTDYIKRV